MSVVDTHGRLLERLRWLANRVEVDGLSMILEEDGASEISHSGDELRLYKKREMVEAICAYLESRREFRPRRIFEMGIWGGGSIVLWNELLRPLRHVAIDLDQRGDSPAFRAWAEQLPDERSVSTHWGIDQSHRERVLELALAELGGPPDLVIDDAAHIVECMQPAFETLFPLLPPGGLYLIEDWSWGHDPRFQTPAHPWRPFTEPTRFLDDLIAATGSSRELISSVHVEADWAVVARGPAALTDPLKFRLVDQIVRRPG